MATRVRISKSMLARHRDVSARLVSIFHEAERYGCPLFEVSTCARSVIAAAGPFTAALAADLESRRRTLWDAAVRRSVWVLYLDGARVTSTEISERREAGDADVWDRVCGRHEWPNGAPFYDDLPPALTRTPEAERQARLRRQLGGE